MPIDMRIRLDEQRFKCQHADSQVVISSKMVFPIRLYGTVAPRLLQRRCDHLVECHLQDKSACPAGVQSI